MVLPALVNFLQEKHAVQGIRENKVKSKVDFNSRVLQYSIITPSADDSAGEAVKGYSLN